MNKIIKVIFIIVAMILTLTCAAIHPIAEESKYSWYCVHVRDHRQPTADARFSFISEYGGFYIDEKHGDKDSEKVIYLTFDAGYENGNVSRILDVMKTEEVTGAFFVLGNLVEKNPDLINRMFDEGHLVCNHTYSHKAMVGYNREQFTAELEKLEEACIRKTGRELSKFYRPPEGVFDRNSLAYAKDMGYKTVFWSFAYADWDNNKQMSASSAKAKILENLHNGEIMLLHPTSKTNADIIGDVIRELKAEGYRFGSLEELCE